MPDETTSELRRRSVLRALGAAGLGTAVSASGAASADEREVESTHHVDSRRTRQVGYHSIGGSGSTEVGGKPDNPHIGGKGPIALHRDRGIAVMSLWSARGSTAGRGAAIIDISGYTTATDLEDIEATSPVVIEYIEDDNTPTRPFDVTLSPDGRYLYLGREVASPTVVQNRAFGPPSVEDGSVDSAAVGQGVAVFDLSDPGQPERVTTYTGPPLGLPGPFYMDATQIAGEDYLFATKFSVGEPSALHIFRFDRDTGTLTPENIWTKNGQLAQGTLDPSYFDGELVTSNDFYIDVTVGRDEQTGRPLAYLTLNNVGVYVLDVSTPTNIQQLGRFKAPGQNYSVDATTLYDGKGNARRVFAVGQYSKNTVYLVDADDVLRGGFDGDLGTASAGDVLATYTYDGNYEDAHTTPLNFVATSPERRHTLFVGGHQAGVRVLDVTFEGELGEQGYFRTHYDVPEKVKDRVHSSVQPLHRYNTLVNGVGMVSATHSGLYAFTPDHPALEVGADRSVDVDIKREMAASVYAGGYTVRSTLTNAGDDAVLVRDRIPSDWTTVGGDPHTTSDAGDGTLVEFDRRLSPGDSATYFASVGGETGEFTVGAAAYSPNGSEWVTLGGVTDRFNIVAGSDGLSDSP